MDDYLTEPKLSAEEREQQRKNSERDEANRRQFQREAAPVLSELAARWQRAGLRKTLPAPRR